MENLNFNNNLGNRMRDNKFENNSNEFVLNNFLIEREFNEVQSNKSNSFSMVNNEDEFYRRTRERYGSHGKEKTSKFAKFFQSSTNTGNLINDLKKSKNKTATNLHLVHSNHGAYIDNEKKIFIYYRRNKSCSSSYKDLVKIKDDYDVNHVLVTKRSKSVKKSSSNTAESNESNYYCSNVDRFKTSNINRIKKSNFYQVESTYTNKGIATANLEINENSRRGKNSFLKSLINENFIENDYISNESSDKENSIEIINNHVIDKKMSLEKSKIIDEYKMSKNKCGLRFKSSKSIKKKLKDSTVRLFKVELHKYSKSVNKVSSTSFYMKLLNNYNNLSSISSISYNQLSKSFSYFENSNEKIMIFKNKRSAFTTSKSNFNLTKSLHIINTTNNNTNTMNFDSMTIDISNKLFNTNSVNLMINEVNNLVNSNINSNKIMKDIPELSLENMLTTTELVKGKFIFIISPCK